MASEVRQGDSVSIGPCMALLSDDTPIDLTGAVIWSSFALDRASTVLGTKKNTAGGGSTNEITDAADPTLGGPFYVKLSSTDTVLCPAGSKIKGDVRVKTTTGQVYTIAEYEFKSIDPYTAVPTAP